LSKNDLKIKVAYKEDWMVVSLKNGRVNKLKHARQLKMMEWI